jgi:cell division septal protein FtsQ
MTSLMSRPVPPSGGADEETVQLERKLFRRRRRWGRLRRVRPLVALVLAVLLVAAGVWAVWFSPLLAANHVDVTGTRALAPVVVRNAAQVPLGHPLARVDLNAVRTRVAALPEVKDVRVTRAWPHGVSIRVTERTAVAVVPRGSGFQGLAADGVLFRTYDARPPGLPVVRDLPGADTEARREAARVVGSLPAAVLSRVDHVSVRTIDDIQLVMRSGRQVMWGDSTQSVQKAEVLTALMRLKSSEIDVRVPGRPTTRP